MDLAEVQELMAELARERPIFHSEADFQHSLAWIMHRRHPDAQVRLEQHVSEGLHFDISVIEREERIALELKYISRGLTVTVNGELFTLRSHGAQPPRRYDVLRDLVRVETLLAQRIVNRGYVIVLTNDSSYWLAGRATEGIGDAFRIHEGRRVKGELRWGMGRLPAPLMVVSLSCTCCASTSPCGATMRRSACATGCSATLFSRLRCLVLCETGRS